MDTLTLDIVVFQQSNNKIPSLSKKSELDIYSKENVNYKFIVIKNSHDLHPGEKLTEFIDGVTNEKISYKPSWQGK